ncbi:MAG: IPT/TIG domain-containing protein [Deltaproteobacteria bacterium]|nr:IPT/TIG domain-containing protein [Deltaproteobacteria bacterium]
MPNRLHSLLLVAALAAGVAACSDDSGNGGQTTSTPDATTTTDTAQPADTSAGDDATAPGDTGGTGPGDTATGPEELTIVEIDPGRGLASGLEQVEIFGTGFAAGDEVYFGESLAQDIFVLNSHRLVVLTPPRGPGLVDVKIVRRVDQTTIQAVLEDGFLYFNPVDIEAVEPATGYLLGGEEVTITGAGFLPDTHVIFGTQSAVSATVLNDHTILAVTPSGNALGAVDLYVSNSQGVGVLRKGFRYVDAPRIDSVTPPAGLVAGGGTVEIKGQGFVAPMTVVFGAGRLTDVQVVDDAHLRGTVPAASAAGAVNVLVSSTYGTTTVLKGYTYVDDLVPGDVLSVLNITPPSGPASGGNRVTIIAKGLTTKDDTTVRFGAAEATVVTVDAAAHYVVVEAPRGSVGAVPVTVENGNGAVTVPEGYVYNPFIRVYEVLPNLGPTAGGTRLTITGEGFLPGATVRVGALPASAVTLVDGSTLQATTPPGSPGLANVTVLQSGLSDTLVGGFAYQGELGLWVAAPPQGSQAGGTFVQLVGSGFPADAKVTFGGRAATHVTVASPSLITCKTPPGDLGVVDVKLTSATRGTAVLREGFTYYDPESNTGGTWGQGVDGDVNVTVLDGSSGAGIPDAFVILRVNPSTPYQGFTNEDGQITFSGPDLLGDQMVSASKEGFASASVVEYNATNVTLFMTPTTPPSPGTPPTIEQPFYRGNVLNVGKSIPVPWGSCASQVGLNPPLCNTCTTDDSCGAAGYRCSDLPEGNGKRCTLHCATNANCPEGFMCFPLNGVEEAQCVPSAGDVTAFCDFSNGGIFAEDLLPDPGIEANPDLSFEIPVPIGEFAVYCWGGVLNRSSGSFTPYALGVARHVFANPGDIIEGDIRLDHPLNKTQTVRLDPVPVGPEGPDINALWSYLDLGSDGTIQFLGQPTSFGDTPFTINNFLANLTGDLYDAHYAFFGGAFALSDTFLPQTLTLHQGIEKLEDDTMYYLLDGEWEEKHTGVTSDIYDLALMGPGDVVGVGTDGLIIRSLGTSWGRQASGVNRTLRGVYPLSPSFAVAVGDGGSITTWDGFQWTKNVSPTSSDLRDVFVVSPTEAYAVGFYTVLKFNGTTWSTMLGNTSRNLQGIWGAAANDIWAVASFGQIIRWDGTSWKVVTSPTTQTLLDVWGSAADDVWMVGEGGTILHWDGATLTQRAVDTLVTLTAVWGSAADDVYAVGARGTVFHYDGSAWTRVSLGGSSTSSSFYAVGGEADAPIVTGSHELILGPILAVPERVKPGNGGLMSEDYSISWEAQPGPDPHFSYVAVSIPTPFGLQDEWTMVNDYDVHAITLPHFPSIEGTPGISNGQKVLTVYRVYKEGFDIDNYSYYDLNQLAWRSWSINQVVFTKQ